MKLKVGKINVDFSKEESIHIINLFDKKILTFLSVIFVLYKMYEKHENTIKELHINDNELEKFRIECETKRLEE